MILTFQKRKMLLYTLVVVFAIVCIYFLYKIREPAAEILRPVMFAFIFAYLLHPLVKFVEERKISRSMSILIVYLFCGLIITMTLGFIMPDLVGSIRDLSQTIPQYIESYEELFERLIQQYKNSGLPTGIQEILDRNILEGQQYLVRQLQMVIHAMTGIVGIAFDILMAAVITFYILRDIEKIKKVCISLIPRKVRKWVVAITGDIDMILSGFIRGQLLVALIISIISTIGLWLLGVKYALVLGIIAGLLDIIPYFGPILSVVPAMIIAFIDKPINAVWVLLLFFGIQQLEGAVLSPRIVGCRVGLHPAIAIIAVLAGGKLFGFAGLLLAVPVAAIINVLGHRIIQSIV